MRIIAYAKFLPKFASKIARILSFYERLRIFTVRKITRCRYCLHISPPPIAEIRCLEIVTSMQIRKQKLVCGLLLVMLCLSVGSSALAFESSRVSGKSKREAFAKSCEFNEKGIALEEQGKPKEAIEQFKMAIAAYSSYSVNYCNYGNALSDLKRYSEAIAQYRKAVELSPDFAAAYSNMADAMTKKKDFMDAELACKSAIRIDPGYVPAMTNLADVYLETNRPHQAIVVLRKAGGLTTTVGMKKIIAENLEKANKMMLASTSADRH